jgi:hypothetical protein
MTEQLNQILQANLSWFQGIVDLLMKPPLIWFVGTSFLFLVLAFIKSLITK